MVLLTVGKSSYPNLPQLVQSRQSPRGKVILDSVKLAVNATITHRHRVSGRACDRHVFFH